MSDSDPNLQDIVAQLLALPRQQWESVRAGQGVSDDQWQEILRRLEYAQLETSPLDEQPLLAQAARRMSDEAEVADVNADLAPAAGVSRYRVLERLGKGGWGTVYKAEQRQPVKRVVAIKMITAGVDTPEVVARFESERQALARMDHPHIAKVFDAGSTRSGRPYFVMEHVPGEPVTAFADRNRLTIPVRLELFQQICQAINHAHMKAVIHRDIKPGNVLAYMHDGKPMAKVIDFGIAKALTGDRLTEQTFNSYRGQVIGTYDSMSPEQASGSADIDTRTDVYSLGVLLYELLCGVKPFDPKMLARAADEEIKRIIQKVEPGRPSTRLASLGKAAEEVAAARQASIDALAKQFRQELEWIPLMAMRKERERRYASPLQLSEDLDNYLKGNRLLAGPESTAYRVRKFVGRNKSALASIAAIIVLLVGGVTVSTTLALRARRAEQTVATQLIDVSREKSEKEKLANERGKLADENGKLATERLSILSITDQQLGHLLMEQGKDADALAYEARSLRENPSNQCAITDSVFLLYRNPLPQGVLQLPQMWFYYSSVAFSPDGTRVVTADSGGAARMWDAATGKPLGESMPHDSGVHVVAFSTDGTRVVTVSPDNTARLWDTATGNPIGEPMRHQGYISCAAFSPDGTRVLTAGADKTARLWDAATGKPLAGPMLHEGVVQSAAFSPDGARVLTSTWCENYTTSRLTTRLWNAATGKPIGEPMPHSGLAFSGDFSPDGTRVVTHGDDNTARLWDAATGKPLGEPMQHGNWVRSAAFSSDGTRVVTASNDNTARLWDAATGKPLGEPMRHESEVCSAAFSPDGTRVVTASHDKTARLWDAATGKPLGEPMRHESEVRFAAFSPDGARVVTASDDKTARLWDAATGKPLREPMRHLGAVLSAAFSPDGGRIVARSNDETARLWDVATGKPLREPIRHEGGLWSAAFSPDGTRVVTASADKTARLWDVATGKPLGEPMRHEGEVRFAAFSPDGTRVITASDDETARLWDAATGKPIGKPMWHMESVLSAAFSPDGMRVVTRSPNWTVRLWDVATGKPLAEPMRDEHAVAADFSPDGTRVVTTSWQGTAQVWDVATGKPLGEPVRYAAPVFSVAFSPDGTRVVAAIAGKTARLWDATTAKPLGEPLRHEANVTSAAFSPNGTRIVTTSDDNTVRLWDVATSKPLGEPMRHEASVQSVAFSPDGKRVVTASHDKTARLWDAATGKPLGEPMRHEADVMSAVFSPDGKQVLTASSDATARLWDVGIKGNQTGHWLAAIDELCALHRLDERGSMAPLANDWVLGRDALLGVARSSETAPAEARWIRWLLTDVRQRTVSPLSDITFDQWLEERLTENTPESLSEAREAAPGNPVLIAREARLAVAGQGKFSASAEFSSALAAQMDPKNPEVLWRRVAVLQLTGRAQQANELAQRCPAPTNAWAWEAKWDACRLLGRAGDAADAEVHALAAATAGGPALAASLRNSLATAKSTPREVRDGKQAPGASPMMISDGKNTPREARDDKQALVARQARMELTMAFSGRIHAESMSAQAAELDPKNPEVLWRRVAVLELTERAQQASELAQRCPAPTDAWSWEAKWDACRLLGRAGDAADAEAHAMAAAMAGEPALVASLRNLIAMIRKRTPEPKSGAELAVAFWFDYDTLPEPGPRQWKQVDGTHWRQVYQDGHFDDFTVLGASPDKENPGAILRRQPDTGYEVLIPPIAEGAPLNFRYSPSYTWRKLSSIHVAPAPSAATQPAPTARPAESSGGTTPPAPPPSRQ